MDEALFALISSRVCLLLGWSVAVVSSWASLFVESIEMAPLFNALLEGLLIQCGLRGME